MYYLITRNTAIAVLLSLCVLTALAQPCVNGISTNPNNPINDQFVQMGNAFWPGNGTDTHNPFLNQFDWYLGNSTITLYPQQVNWQHGFPNNLPTLPMVHPYGGAMPPEFQYLRPDPGNLSPSLRDFRWEDGWELLYMNLGYFPDMHATNNPAPGSYYANHGQNSDPMPGNIPYFAIYNRYRGILRLFANVWYPVGSNFSNINVTLKFTLDTEEQNYMTGLFRHASAYDVALSEPTSIQSIHAPRYQANNLNHSQWLVADFLMAYDPCSCQSLGELEFIFTAFSELNVDIIGRSVAIDVPIDDDNYTTRDFLNMSHVTYDPNNPGSYEPGTKIYQNMDRLAEEYKKKKQKYLDDLNTYNQIAPLRMALEVVGLNAVGQFLASGITNITLTEDLYKWIKLPPTAPLQEELILGSPLPPTTIEFDIPMSQVLDTTIVRAFSDKAKKEIGRVFGNFSAEIFKIASPGKPKAPTVPAATLEESVYKGKITAIDATPSSPLIIPGALPGAYPLGTTLEPHRLPVYNEVLGKVALLNTPKPTARNEISVVEDANDLDYTISKHLELRFDENLLFALNPALDFDLNQSYTYAMLEIEYQEGDFNTSYNYAPVDTLHLESNLSLSQTYFDNSGDPILRSTYSSVWFPMHELSNRVFRISDSFWVWTHYALVPFYTPVLLSIKLKVMHDFYFDQIGTSGEQINTLDVHTYLIYQKDRVNHLQTDGPWSDGSPGYFDLYIPGLITLGNETITTSHQLVHEVIGTEIYINAQEVHINGPLQVEPGYTLIIKALEQIHLQSGATFNPKIHMRIKKDFYDTPVFEYADNAAVYNFCNNSNAYQANTTSASLRQRIEEAMAQQELDELSKANEPQEASLNLYPNPARSELTVQTDGTGIDRLTIFDMSTRPVMQASPGGQSLYRMDIGKLAPGVYIVRAECAGEVLTEKLVVAR